MMSRSPPMLICARMVNCCVTRSLASKSEATLKRNRRFSQACLVCADRDARKTQSQSECRTIVTGEPTFKEELASQDSEFDVNSATEQGDLLQKYEQKLMMDQQENNQAEGSVGRKTLSACDMSAASLTYQSKKAYHDMRRRTSRRFSEEKDTASAPETTDDYDQCISMAVDDIIAGCSVSEAGWCHENWIGDDGESPLAGDSNADQSMPDKAVYEQCMSQAVKESKQARINNEATSHWAEDENTGLEVRYNSESYDLADFAEFLESIQETKRIAASEIEALFRDYVSSNKSQLEADSSTDRTVYDECMNRAAEKAKSENLELAASTFSLDPSVYKEYMNQELGEATGASQFSVYTQWIDERGVPIDSKNEPVVLLSQEPTNLSAVPEKGANQLYLDEIQSLWHREHAATSTSKSSDVFNADQDMDMDMSTDMFMSDKDKNTETANKIFFDKMQSVWDHNQVDLVTEYEPQRDAETDFGEFLRRESEAPEAMDTIQAYRPFKTIQVPTDMKVTRSKVSTGLDDSLQSQRPAVSVHIAAGKAGKGMQKRPTDKPTASKGDGKGRHLHTKLTEKQSHKLVILALQHALDELKSGKANLKTKITFTEP